MSGILCSLLAVLSIWDYPARYPQHVQLRRQFLAASRAGNAAEMERVCQQGVTLLPEDPTWRYNLACSLAYFDNRRNAALDALEKAIDCGFRDAKAIRADTDLARLAKERRFEELVEYAGEMSRRPIMFGPMAGVPATGICGQSVALGEQNLGWDFDVGCFVAHLKLAVASAGGNTGDLYMNRDGGHSPLKVELFPGITQLRLDKEGRDRHMDLDAPNLLVPYPLFGNCSRAFTQGIAWRSLPRALMTADARKLGAMVKFYLSNQTWVFPANADIAPIGKHGDVFSSIAPYWIVTAGRSYSDMPYLRAALQASRSFPVEVKREIVRRGLLAPTIQTLIRKSLRGVTNEVAYLSAAAHPTAFPANGVDVTRLVSGAGAMTEKSIPPLAAVSVTAEAPAAKPPFPELTYATAFAWAYVLRSDDMRRVFRIKAKGSAEYRFVKTHGSGVEVVIEQNAKDEARVVVNRAGMSPTNRVDIAVFGRNPGTGWGAPSYVSFARMDPDAPYSDPILTPRPRPKEK